jgi:hypothetical protein
MRLTVMQQMAKGLPSHGKAMIAIIVMLERVRRFLWHGNVRRALELVSDVEEDVLDITEPDASCEPRDQQAEVPPQARKLLRHVREFGAYIADNAAMIPNYAERHRYGEMVSTAFVESTVNQVVAKRFAKKQQMQWTPRGVHLLLQLRTRTLDATLADDFTRWRQERKAKPTNHARAA